MLIYCGDQSRSKFFSTSPRSRAEVVSFEGFGLRPRAVGGLVGRVRSVELPAAVAGDLPAYR